MAASIAFLAGFLLSEAGVCTSLKAAYKIKEPLLIAGEHHHFSILPAGTVLYFDRGWPEGHLTYHVYFAIKGEIKTEPADATMIDTLWLRTIEPDELPKLLNEYPVTKNELVEILKARKVSKSDVVQILRDWPDD